jgi:hypothetical protein
MSRVPHCGPWRLAATSRRVGRDVQPVRRRWVRQVTFWLPTWRLAIPLLLAAGLVGFGFIRQLHPFLSVNQSVPANVLVVEGWMPDYALEQALELSRQGGIDLVIAAGGPVERGALVSGFATHAELAAQTLRQMGLPNERLVAVPAEPTYRNRTHVSARSVRAYLAKHPLEVRGINVVSVGPHARRTRLVYRRTLKGLCPVGLIAVPPESYDPGRWWASSEGTKNTVVEAAGWLYERLFGGGR